MTTDFGEFELIDHIASLVGVPDKSVVVNIGDDSAVFKSSADSLSLVTTDIFVQGIHFSLEYCTFREIGHKVISANLSDIAAMGGTPTCLVVALSLPKKVDEKAVKMLYEGMNDQCRRYHAVIVGGDTTASPNDLVVSITMLGVVKEKNLLLRSGAQIGDDIFVTGFLGDSIAGYRILNGDRTGRVRRNRLIEKHLMPEPRLREAQSLAASLRITSMIDISDGLSSDLHHICRQSGVGARIDCNKLPVSKEAAVIAERNNEDIFDYALNGGEDFELLFTTSDKQRFAAADEVGREFGIPCTKIGEILDAEEGVCIINPNGRQTDLFAGGWDHMKTEKKPY